MQQDLYARELRLQEDEIYRLEDCIEEYQGIVRSLRQENHKLKHSVGEPIARPKAEKLDDEDEGGERSVLDNFDWSPNRPEREPLPIDPPEEPPPANIPLDDAAPEIELPSIDLGEPAPTSAQPNQAPAPTTLPTEPPPEIDVPSLPEAVEPAEPITPPISDPPPFEPERAASSTNAAPLDLNSMGANSLDEAPPFEPSPLTGAFWQGDAPSDDARSDWARYEPEAFRQPPGSPIEPVTAEAPSMAGLQTIDTIEVDVHHGPPEPTGEATLIALVRPRDPEGVVTLFQGEAAVMLRDPSRDSAAAKLARWDYTADEVAAAWRGLEENPALDFALVLPPAAPTGKSLELWVRLVDEAGEKTLARIAIVLDELPEPGTATARSEQAPPESEPEPVPEPLEPAAGSGWSRRTAAASQAPGTSTPPTAWRSTGDSPGGAESTIRVATFEEDAPARSQQYE